MEDPKRGAAPGGAPDPEAVESLEALVKERRIEEVECLVPDLAGVARGKILPTDKFLAGLRSRGIRIPDSVFQMGITGRYPEEVPDNTRDLCMAPDAATARVVPWYADEPTLQVVCDAEHLDGGPVRSAPRSVLRRVLDQYAEMGLRPVVAPEVEFYLVEMSTDPDLPLRTPVGRSGRRETARAVFGVDAVNEFAHILEDVFNWCEDSGIDIDTLAHESGAGQIEMNFNHGDPMLMADQVFLFKRTVREAALRHKVHGTFMAKPMRSEPGSALHIHQSLINEKTGRNAFSHGTGRETALFLAYMGGLQQHVLAATPLFAPYVNSYRRLTRGIDAPTNTHWGYDNRTVGFRVPIDRPEARRIENRVPGADANPYLAIAATLACGLIGIREKRRPRKPLGTERSAWDLSHALPLTLYEALDRFERSKPLREALGEEFTEIYAAVKRSEMEDFLEVISPWEREHLLLAVLAGRAAGGQQPMEQTQRAPGNSTARWKEMDVRFHLNPQNNYRALKAVAGGSRIVASAKGAWITDSDGNRFLDGMAGLWCVQVGYGRSDFAEAARAQMEQLSYYNTFFQTANPPAVELAARIAEVAPGDCRRVFYASSGSESNDTFVRLVRFYWSLKGQPQRTNFITREYSYHGSTQTAASLGGLRPMHERFGIPLPGFHHVMAPYPFAERRDGETDEELGLRAARAVEEKILELGPDTVAAFLGEPIQGAGGAIVPPDSYWPEVERICRRHGVLFGLDEVICGFGRTGHWFAGPGLWGLKPDFTTVAKGLTSGYMPLSALLVSDRIAEELLEHDAEFMHGYTYSGHPVSCAVGLANLNALRDEGIIDRFRGEIAPLLGRMLRERLEGHPLVGEVRVAGGLAAVELAADREARRPFPPERGAGMVCRRHCIDVGLISRAVRDSMVLCPPLVVTPAEVDEITGRLREAVDRAAAELLGLGRRGDPSPSGPRTTGRTGPPLAERSPGG